MIQISGHQGKLNATCLIVELYSSDSALLTEENIGKKKNKEFNTMENVFFVITEKWFVVLDLYISLYISLHVLSSFFFSPVYCLFFFDLRLLITPFVSLKCLFLIYSLRFCLSESFMTL